MSSKTIAGMDLALINHVKTLQQYGDKLTILPDKHRVMMKVLGPLYDANLKLKMGLESVKDTFGGAGKASTKATTAMEKGGKKANKTLGSMVKTVGLLGVVFAPLTAALTLTKGLFMGIVATLMPFIGIVFGVMAAVMLLVAIFDQGGGSLRAWLEDLPLVGDAFLLVQKGVDAVKGALGSIDWGGVKQGLGDTGAKAKEVFGPAWNALTAGLSDAIAGQVERIKALWETLKANITLPEMDTEGFFGAISAGMESAVNVFFELYNSVYDAIFGLLTALVEQGVVQGFIDGLTAMFDGVMSFYDSIMGALDDVGVGFGDIMDALMGLWDYFIGFLIDSGLMAYLAEWMAYIGEVYGFIAFIAGKIIALIIKVIAWAYPFIAPYYRMVINALGFVLTPILLVMRTVMTVIRVVMALLMGNTDKAKQLWGGIVDMWAKGWDKMKGFAAKAVNALIDFTSPLWKGINAGIKLANKIPGVNIKKIDYQSWKFEKGGVASGPQSGYPVELHGTEAIVPLPDGRSIPVTMKGMGSGGGGATNITINVSGVSGDGRKLARQISEEVARALRSRSRGSGGISRGI